ncbi:unnamed protein product [Calicophoron daubneyi]
MNKTFVELPSGPVVPAVPKCPGYFCGRAMNSSTCSACPWGTRVYPLDFAHDQSACQTCLSTPTLHGGLYLGFIALLPLLFFFSIVPAESELSSSTLYKKSDQFVRAISSPVFEFVRSSAQLPRVEQPTDARPKRPCKLWVLGLCCIILHGIVCILVLLLFPPFGSLSLYTCNPQSLEDFYVPLVASSGCSYEAVFPYTSLPLAYYAISALVSILMHLLLCISVKNDSDWRRVSYLSLYSYPVLGIIVITFGGLLYFTFPYVLLSLAVSHSVYHFPVLFDFCVKSPDEALTPVCNPTVLFRAALLHIRRYGWSLIVSALCYSYALLPITDLSYWIIPLSLLPFLIYALTLPFTHPFVAFDGDRVRNLATGQQFACNAFRLSGTRQDQ